MTRQAGADKGRIGDASGMRQAIADRFGLTDAEATVAVMLLQGASYETAARRLGIARNTVHTHVKAIHRKAGVATTLELVALFHGARVRKPLKPIRRHHPIRGYPTPVTGDSLPATLTPTRRPISLRRRP